MLQTSTNQLNPRLIILKHRRTLTNVLINANYNITNPYTNLEKSPPYLIDASKSPIDVVLDIDYHKTLQYEYIKIEYNPLEYRNLMVYCKQFTTKDIQALAKLYIHMLQNNITSHSKNLNIPIEQNLHPGQLAEIISAYLNEGSNPNVTDI